MNPVAVIMDSVFFSVYFLLFRILISIVFFGHTLLCSLSLSYRKCQLRGIAMTSVINRLQDPKRRDPEMQALIDAEIKKFESEPPGVLNYIIPKIWLGILAAPSSKND